MEIINKQHEGYKSERRIKNGKPFIYFAKNMKRFFISARAAYDFDLMPGMCLHFGFDMERLYLFFNEDPSGLVSVAHYGGLKFQSQLIIDILSKKSELIEPGARFMLKRGINRIHDSVTLEVLFNKPIKTNYR